MLLDGVTWLTVYYNENICWWQLVIDMCYQRHIKDIVADIIDVVEKVVYDTWNLTYKLFQQGYSSALIEYRFMDPTIPLCWHYHGHLKNTDLCKSSILQDVTTFTKLEDHLYWVNSKLW